MIKNRIKQIRNSLNWTQEDLAIRSGVSVSSIGRMENEQQLPNLYSALCVCKALDKFLDEVFYIEGKEKPLSI